MKRLTGNLFNTWKKLSIKNKFLSVSLFTISCILFFVTTTFFVKELLDLKTDYEKELKTISKTISSNIASSLIFHDKNTGKEILSHLSSMENIKAAAVYDREGRLFAVYKKKHNDIKFESIPQKKFGIHYSLKDIELYEQIYFEKNPIGTIFIKSDLSKFYSKIKTIIFIIVFVTVLSILFSYFILNKLQMLIIEPINNLANVMDIISRKRDYTKRAEVTSKDEVGYLAMVFNEMLETIHVHSIELEKYRKHLEDLVQKRTEELIEKNMELERELAERKRLEQQLIHSQKMEAIGTLAGGVAHDFNNLLTVILGYGELLKFKFKDNENLMRYVENIITSAEKGKRLTEGLLAFSRKQVSIPKPINLNEVIRDIEKIIKRLIGEDIELNVKLSEKDIIILADYGQIEQIIINLITNARDAMPRGGEITIETSLFNMEEDFISKYGYGEKGIYGMLKITDTGVGMDKKVMERIFEPFFTTKEVGKGTGLGLSIVYGIVKQNKGYINVESEIEKGSTFTVYFPVVESHVSLAGKHLIDMPTETGKGETILVAEDDDALRDLIKTVLEQFNYNVIVAVDGEDAVNKFIEKKKDIHLVILDVVMPKINGKEVYNKLKEIKPETQALFISGYTSDFLSSKDIALENLEFIQKPVMPQVLIEKVKNMLNSPV